MRTPHFLLALLAAWLLHSPLARAQQLLAPDKTIPEVVDHYIDAALQEEGVKPAGQADDATLVRRLTLDLVGRIPTPSEVRAFVSSTDPNKRTQLVDRLLASPGFVRHQVNEFDALLMDGAPGGLRGYLTLAFQENRGWDQVFRELIRADESNPKTKGSSAFLKQNVKDLDRLTNQVSVLFFGVNVSCAQCHDHPLVKDWKQDHFFGMKSFFGRTYDAGGTVAERDAGVVQFKTTKGVSRQAKMMFLTGKVVEEPAGKPSPGGEKKDIKTPDKKARPGKDAPAPPAPKFSARGQLVEIALRPGEREFFARAIVNRVWVRLHGTGLVAPLDQMHSENPPTHPELLAWLARDTSEHGYDLRRLIRGLVLSKTYSRSSRWEGGAFPKPQTYAVARLRALTPMQLATSLRIATSASAAFTTGKPEEIEKRLEGLENSARGLAGAFEQPRDDFQIGVTEALFFSNGDRIQREYLADGGDRLVGELKTIKDPGALVDSLVQGVLGRPASPTEKGLLTDYYARRKERPADALRQMTWALLASPEFRFNH
jgi:hypothetical protein